MRKRKEKREKEIVLHDGRRQFLLLIKTHRCDLCKEVRSLLTFVFITSNEYIFPIHICLKYQT